ncbi:MAG: UTP--glucose-1-phosphate uridylyltransferase [Bdellovibrionaceae bacterium]|nr:UTP--glucose-1-phosphate uridylyltransferase [Pseudobdellovibrionaceae bacterium]
MGSIKKALIPTAGLGTRFLPITSSVPKEMLPIVDEPLLLHVVREVAMAGIEDVVLITGRRKTAIEDFFDRHVELEEALERSGKQDLLERLNEIRNMVNIISIRQKQALGLGHAVYMGKPVIGNEPFAVLLGDELMLPPTPETPTVTKQLCDTYEETQISTVAIMEVAKSEVSKYGIIAGKKEDKWIRVHDVVEKPDADQAPSSWALPGRYVFSGEIFSHLENLPPGRNGEIQLTDAMCKLAQDNKLLARFFDGLRYDAGDKLGYLIANIEIGLQHPQIGESLRQYLKQLSGKLK